MAMRNVRLPSVLGALLGRTAAAPRAPRAWSPFSVAAERDGQRVSDVLCARHDVSPEIVRVLLARGKIAVAAAGRVSTPRTDVALRHGERVVLSEHTLPERAPWAPSGAGGRLADAPPETAAGGAWTPGDAWHCVVYEDARVLVLNKPAGMPLVRTAQTPGGRRVLAEALPLLLAEGDEHTVVTGLSEEVSGAVVVARTRQAAAELAAVFSEDGLAGRRAEVVYHAVVVGGMPRTKSTRVTSALYRRGGRDVVAAVRAQRARDARTAPERQRESLALRVRSVLGSSPVAPRIGESASGARSDSQRTPKSAVVRQRMTSFADRRADAQDEGRVAVTLVRWMQCHRAPTKRRLAVWKWKRPRYSLVELRPLTGRADQARVHLAEQLGAPVLGDYVYGGRLQPLHGMRDVLGVCDGGQSSRLYAKEHAPAWMTNAEHAALAIEGRRLMAGRARDVPLHLHASRVVLRGWRGEGVRHDLVVRAPMPAHMLRTLHANPLVLRDVPRFARKP